MEKYRHYNLFADIFRYPGKEYPAQVKECYAMLQDLYPELAPKFVPFLDYTLSRSVDEREELFTKTFDVQPICYLDLGFVIFGEDYKRGAFLLHMQGEQIHAGNDCGSDLPDNLSNMLTLYAKSDDRALLEELAVKIMIPGIEKLIGEFKQARIDLKVKILKKLQRAIIQEELNRGNIYRDAFEVLLGVFQSDFKHVSFEQQESLIDLHHHQSFFGKNTINAEANTIAANYKLD